MIVGEDVEIFEHIYDGRNIKQCSHFEKWFRNSSKIKHKFIILASHSNPRYIPKELKICLHKNLYRNIQISTIHNWLKVETIKISTDKWVNKRWCIHSVEYNSAERKKGRVIHATTWMDLENIIPVKRVRTQTSHITWFLLYECLE